MSLNACVRVSVGGGGRSLFVCVCERNLRSLRLLTDYRLRMSRVCQRRSAMTGWKSASNGVSMDDINHLHETPVTFPLLAINQPYTEWDDGLKLSYPLSFCLSLYLSFPVLWLVSSHHSWAFIPPYLLVSIFLFGFPSLQPSIRLLFGKSASRLLSYLDSWSDWWRLIMLFSSIKSSFLLSKVALMESQMSSFIHCHVVPNPYDLLSSV